MPARTVNTVVPSVRAVEGGGFVVHRPFPTQRLDHVDPFLLLDHFGPVDYAPGEAKGAPDHPHRGFETVSYILAGSMEHRDSAGHAGSLRPGDVQWMTAGDGIVHCEMPSLDVQRQGGTVEGFQIWVNLPKRDKRMKPRYQEVPGAKIPTATSPDGLATVKVVAGEALGVSAVIDTRTPILYHHWMLRKGASVEVPVPADYNVLAYVFRGTAEISGTAAKSDTMVGLNRDGDVVWLAAPTEDAQLLLLGGQPLNEPVARYGPFVMNTVGEVKQAILDFQTGKMGHIPADVPRF
jgi:redox-sensitive bicupin YhaK (pirin superfamily)